MFAFQRAEKYLSVCIRLAKFGRPKAHQKDYIFKKSRTAQVSYESKKYISIRLIHKMDTCPKNLGAIMKQ